ncbi:hypothetical protein [Asanoa iriomotensis]|uniref:hypothetical protein n=1 Tax=Asanoa iriomotensis TaxID=234613 RepID=UPI001942FCB7|nr:hypothetical protein [Asanoa iriomotensis]
MTAVMPAAAAATSASTTYEHRDFDEFYAAKFDVLRSQLYAYLFRRSWPTSTASPATSW